MSLKKIVSNDLVIEEGVVCELDGKYWGKQYQDGYSTAYGWGNIENARISDPKFCKIPEDMTYKGSPDAEILARGRLIAIRKTISAARV